MADFELEAALDRSEREPGATPARVLREAERLFAERGFDGVTIRDVASAAGINVSTLHFHWKSKRMLYEAVCRFHARPLLSAIEKARRGTKGERLAPAEQLARGIDHAIALMLEHPAIAPLAVQSVSLNDAPELPTLFRHDVSLFRLLESEVGKHMRAGDAADVEPMLAILAVFYFAIVAFSDSPLQQALLGGSVYESRALQERIRRFGRTLLERAVAPRE
jgi:AcrR family transcriptional regulator